MLKSKMNFWCDRGILKELSNDEWWLLETAEEIDPNKGGYYHDLYYKIQYY